MAFNKNRVMDAARRYMEKGQIDKAIKEYLRVVQEDPKDVRVWLKIGDLYAKKGAKPEATETYLKVARFYGEQGFYLKAVAVYKQILKLDPRLIEVNLKLAELYRQMGLMKEAMQHFEMVAGHFHREGKTKEAMATVRQLVELDPENVATRIKLAELYSKEGMLDEAIAEFAKACDYLRANNREDDFIKVAERLLWHKADNLDLNRELATVYLRRNDPRRALQKLQTCFKANARDVETLALLAQAFQALSQKSKTVQVLKELARVFDEDGKRDRAGEVHRRILALAPGDQDAQTYLGMSPQAGAAPAPAPVRPVTRERLVSNDFPERRKLNPTGSVPLIDPSAIPSIKYHPAEPAAPPAAQQPLTPAAFAPPDAAASAEANADKIAKILTETEVYVKYGLHHKAIEHLRSVFNLDAENIEARERLKDIYLAQERERDALQELMRLAEVTSRRDPERAAGYLREVLSIDGTYQPAFELASRARINLTNSEPGVELIGRSGDKRDGAVAPIEESEELDFGDIEFEESLDLISADEEIRPGSEALDGPESYEFELDAIMDSDISLADSMAITAELSDVQVDAVLDALNQENAAARPASATEFIYPEQTGLGDDDELMFDPAAAAAFDAEPGFMDTGDATSFENEPIFDPMEAVAFDIERASAHRAFTSGEPVTAVAADEPSFDEPSVATVELSASDLDAEPLSELSSLGSYDELEVPKRRRRGGEDFSGDGQTDLVSMNDLLGLDLRETFENRGGEGFPFETVDTGIEILDEISGGQGTRPARSLEDELDEADFFITQGLYSEAREIITNLLKTYPKHPLLLAKLEDLAMEGQSESEVYISAPRLGYGDLGGVAKDVLDTQSRRQPSVLVGNHVDDEDAETHYELGLAYKEMGLYDDAIKAFMKVTQAREIPSRLMIGLCYREKGELFEAIHQFKAGLHAAGIVEREQLSLYYEIALTYEAMRDPKEALYFYELINKRDAEYRDVARRIAVLLKHPGSAQRRDVNAADAEAAIDSLLAETESTRRGG